MFNFESDKVDPRFAPPGSHPEVKNDDQGEIIAAPVPVNPLAIIAEAKPASVIPMPPPIQRSSAPRQAAREREAVSQPLTFGVKRRDWMWIGFAAALFSTVIVLGFGLAFVINSSRQNVSAGVATPVAALPTPVDARIHYEANQAKPPNAPSASGNVTLTAGENVKLDDGSSIVLQPWNGTSRLNILIMGIDRRPGETGLAFRSDTMMLASFDPKTKQLGILSIPRDLYVPIPGYSAPQRINSALALGEQQRAGFGPTLAMQAVQVNLGMGVNAYMVADFTALIKLVDDIGGIDVDVPEPIADYQFPSMSYGYDPLILKAGLQHMDGYTAQKYARTRHGDSDFDRAHRQQQVIFAIRDRILSANSLPQLILQAPSLYASVSQNVYTQLSLNQMIQLALWLKDLPADNIHTGVIDQHYVYNFTTSDGAEVLVPYQYGFSNLLTQVFGSDYNQQ